MFARGHDVGAAKAALGAMTVEEVQRQLDALISAREETQRTAPREEQRAAALDEEAP